MRILIVCPDCPVPPRDGGSLRIANLARSLGARADVLLMSYVTSADNARPLDDFGRQAGVRVRGVLRPGRGGLGARAWHKLAHYYIPFLFTSTPGPARFNLRPAMRGALTQVLGEFRPEAILWEYWFMAGFAEQARRLAPGAVQVLDAHELEWVRLQGMARTRSGWDSAWARFISPRVRGYALDRFRSVDAVALFTSADEKRVRDEWAGFGEGFVLPMGLMSRDYPDLGPGRSDRLVFFGSFRHSPNRDALEVLLKEVLPLIRNERPEVGLDIMGPWLPSGLDRLAREEPGVRVLGCREDIRPVLREAGVVIVPLRFGSGAKVKLLEAMALGKTVVTTSAGAEGIDAAPGEEWIVADAPDLMARESLRLLGDERARAEMGRRARAQCTRQHDAARIAGELVDTLRAMIRARGGAGLD
jgi:polysaccharide biosynthesis protein PslH